jgi:L-threonylcarbamoyladenylate synthase
LPVDKPDRCVYFREDEHTTGETPARILDAMNAAWKTEVLGISTPEEFGRAVRRAAACLQAGEIVAVPTETVYGLAANALNPTAVARLFEAKQRPAFNPIIVHVASIAMARRCVAQWPGSADVLASRFWPGPLTLVLPRAAEIPSMVTAGGPTVGVRCPRHPFISALIEACGFPLAAPSANLSGQISPTLAQHVLRGLSGRIPLVIDAGPTTVGIESTVVDLASDPPHLLRPGMIDLAQLRLVLPNILAAGSENPSDLRSPGLLAQHYAPRARLILLDWTDTDDLLRQLADCGQEGEFVHVIAHSRIPDSRIGDRVHHGPPDAAGFANFLYAALHDCDDAGARLIVVERPPSTIEWVGIMDRLRRASAEAR